MRGRWPRVDRSRFLLRGARARTGLGTRTGARVARVLGDEPRKLFFDRVGDGWIEQTPVIAGVDELGECAGTAGHDHVPLGLVFTRCFRAHEHHPLSAPGNEYSRRAARPILGADRDQRKARKKPRLLTRNRDRVLHAGFESRKHYRPGRDVMSVTTLDRMERGAELLLGVSRRAPAE